MCAPAAFAFLRGTRGFSVRFASGILFFCAAKVPGDAGRGVEALERPRWEKPRIPGPLPLSASRSERRGPPALSDSAPGSQAELERERWRRPGTCRATFVLGADCGRQRAAPSEPDRKGARACARPWEPRLLPVPASSRRKQSLGRAGRLGREWAARRPGPGPCSAVGASRLGCSRACSCE